MAEENYLQTIERWIHNGDYYVLSILAIFSVISILLYRYMNDGHKKNTNKPLDEKEKVDREIFEHNKDDKDFKNRQSIIKKMMDKDNNNKEYSKLTVVISDLLSDKEFSYMLNSKGLQKEDIKILGNGLLTFFNITFIKRLENGINGFPAYNSNNSQHKFSKYYFPAFNAIKNNNDYLQKFDFNQEEKLIFFEYLDSAIAAYKEIQ